MSRRVLITGIGGQDGSYLTEALLERGDSVIGLVARELEIPPFYLKSLASKPENRDRLEFRSGNLEDPQLFYDLLHETQPDLIFHLAAVSSVAMCFRLPLLAAEVNGRATLRLLEAARMRCPDARIFLAVSGELFGEAGTRVDESTPFAPKNPYAASKAMSFWGGVNYRESYGQFVSNGILLNHESPRRPLNYLSRKVIRGTIDIARGIEDQLVLGNLKPVRDWGYAPEYMQAAIKMLEASEPDDYIIATGVSHSVEDLVRVAFELKDLDYSKYVVQNPDFFRPTDVARIEANPEKIEKKLGWKAQTDFRGLIQKLIEAEEATMRESE